MYRKLTNSERQSHYADRVAFKDISEEIKKNYPVQFNNDVWVVTPNMLNSKHTRRLNAQLGLRSINRNAENMNRLKK